ncbi:MAG TPA: SDR family oxidoreductase, partial [Solirubrobacterales bacterium]|nr:SDR family oxidoreductase [Solirubrobacterales bacterium]
ILGLLDDKAILITGAASGIGRATAQEAHAEGARLLLADVNDEQGESVAAEIGDGASYVHCDVTDEASVQAAVAGAVSELGRLDGAFNCAGILGSLGNVGDVEFDDWKKILDVDLNGVFLCTKHELRVMAEQGSGSILNMASAAGLIGWPAAAGYVAAKHGVVGLTKSAALEYAEQGIRVNSICPSYVLTPMVEKDLFEDALGNDQELIAAARANHPIGRFAEVDEIAAAATWLLSDKASFVTGTAMSVDGGYTAP